MSNITLRRSTQSALLGLGLIVAAACAPAPQLAVAPSAAAGPRVAAPDTHPLPPSGEPRMLTAADYSARRAALAERMEDGIFVAFGAAAPDMDFLPYAQNSSFRYLTGIVEADAGLIVAKEGGRVEEYLFVMRRNPERELWEGARLGVEGAQAISGAPAQTNDRFIPMVDALVARVGTLYTLTPPLGDVLREGTLTRDQQILQGILERNPGKRVVPIGQALRDLRARKSETEVDLIRRAVHISTLSQRESMRSARPGMNEFEIHALIEYFFRRYGAERPAFGSIVGSGPNSTTLHYRAADRYMQDGEVVLLDIGASYRGYSADVTRTIPVNGRFSPEQREIYEIVLAAQKAAEEEVRVGARWDALNAAANRVIEEGLSRLGLIDAPGATYFCESPARNNECPQYRLFYMHGLGHGIGLDVHDPDISTSEGFQIGSAFTIEPGIYVRADALDFLRDTPENRAMIERLRPALERYRNIGVRIEDSFLITAAGVERASSAAPREIDEIEALMAETGLGETHRRPEIVEWYRSSGPVQ